MARLFVCCVTAWNLLIGLITSRSVKQMCDSFDASGLIILLLIQRDIPDYFVDALSILWLEICTINCISKCRRHWDIVLCLVIVLRDLMRRCNMLFCVYIAGRDLRIVDKEIIDCHDRVRAKSISLAVHYLSKGFLLLRFYYYSKFISKFVIVIFISEVYPTYLKYHVGFNSRLTCHCCSVLAYWCLAA